MKKMVSIFEKYYINEEFLDRKELKNEKGIDIIIPLINTNPIFKKNLYSFYREIPINRLLIGNGGCSDDSIEIVKKFPRVEVIDQSRYDSLGYCIAELISKVKTEWFIYLHADVYLPDKWYDIMKNYQNVYDWFECDRRMTTLIEFNRPELRKLERAYSGSQMGRTKAFENIIGKVKDDYLQRNEDIIFKELILAEGFKYGRIFDTFHYHQIMNKKGEMEPKFEKIYIQKVLDKQWEIRMITLQVKGIIKYLKPKKYLIKLVNTYLKISKKLNALNIKEFKAWVNSTNKIWLKYINFGDSPWIKLRDKIISMIKNIFDKLVIMH